MYPRYSQRVFCLPISEQCEARFPQIQPVGGRLLTLEYGAFRWCRPFILKVLKLRPELQIGRGIGENRQAAIEGWTGVDAMLSCFRQQIDHPKVRLIDDDQAVNPFVGVRCLLDSAITIPGAIQNFWFGSEATRRSVRALQNNLDFDHCFGKLLGERHASE